MNKPINGIIDLEGDGDGVEWDPPNEWRPRPGANSIVLFFEAEEGEAAGVGIPHGELPTPRSGMQRPGMPPPGMPPPGIEPLGCPV